MIGTCRRNEEAVPGLSGEEVQTISSASLVAERSCGERREQLHRIRQVGEESVEYFANRIKKINVNTYESLGDNPVQNEVIRFKVDQRALDAFLNGPVREIGHDESSKGIDESAEEIVRFKWLEDRNPSPVLSTDPEAWPRGRSRKTSINQKVDKKQKRSTLPTPPPTSTTQRVGTHPKTLSNRYSRDLVRTQLEPVVVQTTESGIASSLYMFKKVNKHCQKSDPAADYRASKARSHSASFGATRAKTLVHWCQSRELPLEPREPGSATVGLNSPSNLTARTTGAQVVELNSSVFLDVPLEGNTDTGPHNHQIQPQMLPVGRIRCGMWASFALATVFVAGAKFYFDHQDVLRRIVIIDYRIQNVKRGMAVLYKMHRHIRKGTSLRERGGMMGHPSAGMNCAFKCSERASSFFWSELATPFHPTIGSLVCGITSSSSSSTTGTFPSSSAGSLRNNRYLILLVTKKLRTSRRKRLWIEKWVVVEGHQAMLIHGVKEQSLACPVPVSGLAYPGEDQLIQRLCTMGQYHVLYTTTSDDLSDLGVVVVNYATNEHFCDFFKYLNKMKEGFGNQINLCRDRGVNPGTPAQKFDTLPLNHQGAGLEVLVFCSLLVVFLLAGCTVSLCRSKITRDLLSAAVTTSQPHHSTLTMQTPAQIMGPTPAPLVPEPPPPPYHIAVLLPHQNNAQQSTDDSPPPSYEKAIS
uniref:Uncharacterized protein n=1 Tax=Timema cristinae TaxID=61476 RepID=A0A7R9D837_TIMCR|nr:unnamed protein product [Timema cristinae]